MNSYGGSKEATYLPRSERIARQNAEFKEPVYEQLSQASFGYNPGIIQRSYVSESQREFVLDKNNWASKTEQQEWIKKIKDGDDHHENKDYDQEGYAHRKVQEEIQKRGGVGHYDSEGQKAYGWNSLYIHHGDFINKLKDEGGYSFDDTFYYDGNNNRYYLKSDALAYARRNNLTYYQTGNLSIVAPKDQVSNVPYRKPVQQNPEITHDKPVQQSREMTYDEYCSGSNKNNFSGTSSKPVLHSCWNSIPGYSNSEYVTVKPYSGSESFFPPFGTQEAKDYCEAVRRIRGY